MTNNNELTKNKNKEDINSIINNAKKSQKVIRAWKIVANEKIFVDLKITIVRKATQKFVVKAVTNTSKEFVKNMNYGVKSMYFYLPDDLVLFESRISQSRIENSFEVEIPKMIAHIERRKQLRLFIEEGILAKIEFNKGGQGQSSHKQYFKKDCFDISGGGLSFVISKTEARLFKEGDHLTKAKVFIDDVEHLINADIVTMIEVEPSKQNKLNYKGYKVCVSFNNINHQIQEDLDKFVFNYLDIAV